MRPHQKKKKGNLNIADLQLNPIRGKVKRNHHLQMRAVKLQSQSGYVYVACFRPNPEPNDDSSMHTHL